MPTITISDDVYQLLERQAQSIGCAPDELLNHLIRQQFAPAPDINAQQPSTASSASYHATEQALAEQNLATFKQLLPDLLQAHKDEYVAIRHGDVVGFGPNGKTLWYKMCARYGVGGILVMKVTDTPRVAHISSPLTMNKITDASL
jgi:hypothetical protein